MQYLKKLWSNAKKTYDLQEKYYKLTSAIGLIGFFFFTIPLTITGFILLALKFGADSAITMALILPVFFLCLPLGMSLAALLFAVPMAIRGSITRQEAINYVKYGEYPAKWFKQTEQSRARR